MNLLILKLFNKSNNTASIVSNSNLKLLFKSLVEYTFCPWIKIHTPSPSISFNTKDGIDKTAGLPKIFESVWVSFALLIELGVQRLKKPFKCLLWI